MLNVIEGEDEFSLRFRIDGSRLNCVFGDNVINDSKELVHSLSIRMLQLSVNEKYIGHLPTV